MCIEVEVCDFAYLDENDKLQCRLKKHGLLEILNPKCKKEV